MYVRMYVCLFFVCMFVCMHVCMHACMYVSMRATVPHITLWLDRAGCCAAAYVALSRVQKAEDYLIAGKVRPAHFVPAQ